MPEEGLAKALCTSCSAHVPVLHRFGSSVQTLTEDTMHPLRNVFRAGLIPVVLACSVTRGLSGQQVPNANPGLRERMTEFLNALPDERSSDSTRRFFPTTGDWSYTRTVDLSDANSRVERWIVPAAETSLLFGSGKGIGPTPTDESFEIIYEHQKAGTLLDVIMRTSNDWRLVGQNRFVPPSAPDSSPVYVEWRKEGEAWVINAFGDAWFGLDRLPPWYVGGDR